MRAGLGGVSRGVELIVLLAVGSLIAIAQPLPYGGVIESLVTNGDGSELYFSTRRPLKKGDSHVQGRIFRLTESGLEIAAAVPYVPPPPLSELDLFNGKISLSNYYDFSEPQISSDGSVLGYVAQRECDGRVEACFDVQYRRSLFKSDHPLADGIAEEGLPGSGRISRNGRYWATYEPGTNSGRGQVGITDLITGAQHVFPDYNYSSNPTFAQGRVVADDGTTVFAEGGSLLLLRDGKAGFLNTSYVTSYNAVISADASTIVFRAISNSSNVLSLMVYDLRTDTERFLMHGGDGAAPQISADGQRIVYLSSGVDLPRIWTVLIDGSGRSKLTDEPYGVRAFAMSDDGRIAWYVTYDGRVVRMNISTAATQDVLKTSYLVQEFSNTPASGSALTFLGQGFTGGAESADGFPLPLKLGGIEVKIGGINVPLLNVSPISITVQVPWGSVEEKPLPVEIISSYAAESPFRGPGEDEVLNITIYDIAPTLLNSKESKSHHERLLAARLP